MSLNPRQIAYAKHYAIHGDHADAVQQAGYAPNCSRRTRQEFAFHHLRNKPEIQKLITEVQRQAVEASAIEASHIIGQVLRIAMESKRDDVRLKAWMLLWEWCGLAHQEPKANVQGILRAFEKAFGKELAKKVAEQLKPE